jgi:hypothetical protein
MFALSVRGLCVYALTAVALLSLLAGCEKTALDGDLRRLCGKDGGITVYERVVLPIEKFDKYGVINFYRPTLGENALGPDYRFLEERLYYRKGSPEMWRTHYRVVRTSDQKLLGEAVIYVRRGGDMPSFMHDSSLICPEHSGDGALVSRIFRQSTEVTSESK